MWMVSVQLKITHSVGSAATLKNYGSVKTLVRQVSVVTSFLESLCRSGFVRMANN